MTINKIRRVISLVIILVLSCSIISAQEDNVEGLRKGVLANGLSYYIMKSDLQKGEASFYLIQKVGAIVEKDDEDGLAHFLEHMAFGGSKHFPDGIKLYMNSIGVSKFNAYTSTDETVYNVDDVKTDNPQIIDTCIYLLRDWCGDLLLKPEAMDKQRGVITEEWRTRQTLQKRRQDALSPYIFNHSKYAVRDVIGSLDIVNNFKPETLSQFYEKWYQSNLQGVIIVGDIDPDQIEAKIKRIFGDLNPSPKAEKREYFSIDDQKETYYVPFFDEEVKRNSISIYGRELTKISSDPMEVRQESQIRSIYNNLCVDRLVKFKNSNDVQFFTADISFQKLIQKYYLNSISVTPFPGKDEEALRQVMTVYEQIHRFGFTDKEVEGQKQAIYEQLEAAKKSVKQFKNSVYVSKMKANFLDGYSITGLEDGIEKNEEALLEIDVDQVNAWIKKRDYKKNSLITVEAHDKEKAVLSKEAIEKICKEVANSDLKEEKQIITDTVFMDFKPKTGSIVKVETLKQFDAEAWTLSNGAKVVYKYTKEGNGHFAFTASSFGGKSILAPNEIPSANALTSLATRSGIYKHDKNTMNAMLRNKNMSLNMNYTELQMGVSGGAPVAQAPLFFQVVYLFLTHPRFDKSDFDKFIHKEEYKISTQEQTPLDSISDKIHDITTISNDRDWKLDEHYISSMNFEQMKQIFDQHFKENTGNFTYYLVGDLPKDKAKQLITQYVASLPASSKAKENYVLHDFSVNAPKIERSFEIEMPGDKSMVNITYLNRLNLTSKDKLAFAIMAGTLTNRYFNTIREAEGGAYGVRVEPSISDFPQNRQQLRITFQTKAGKEVVLKPMVYKEIDDIRTNGIRNFELTEALLKMKDAHEASISRRTVPYWMNVLTNYEEGGIDITSKDRFENVIDTITLEDVKNVAEVFFKGAKLRDMVISSLPEEEEHYKH